MEKINTENNKNYEFKDSETNLSRELDGNEKKSLITEIVNLKVFKFLSFNNRIINNSNNKTYSDLVLKRKDNNENTLKYNNVDNFKNNNYLNYKRLKSAALKKATNYQ